MKILQQENAIETFKTWLIRLRKVEKEPSEIEIYNTFNYKGEEFAIIKFKIDLNSPYLLGISGGFRQNDNTPQGYVWSKFEEFDEKTAEQKCIKYIEIIGKTYKRPCENHDYGFMFQIPESFKEVQFDRDAQPCHKLHQLENDKGETIILSYISFFKTDEEYEQQISKLKKFYIKSGYNLIYESHFSCKSGIKVTKINLKTPQQELFVEYLFKFNKNTIGSIYAKNVSSIQRDINVILNSWKYLCEQNENEKPLKNDETIKGFTKNIEEIKCFRCGNVRKFDLTKVPRGVKFEFICEKCGAINIVKL